MSVEANRAVARTALEQVCSRGDLDLARRCYSESFADHAGPLEYHGIDGVRRSTAFYRELFDELAFEVVDQVAEGDRVASRWTVYGTHQGQLGPFAPTGQRLAISGLSIYRIADGKIVEGWVQDDTRQLLAAAAAPGQAPAAASTR